MSAQRARRAVSAEHRSAHPGIAGVPWWGAIIIATALTTVGFAFDAGTGSKQLTTVFAALYVLGCVVAVLAVQQSGLFTAAIQPPLILFVSVPGAYFLFHGGTFTGLKNLAINCGYPLIERFPLMLFGTAAVLLIGLARWSFGMTSRDTADTSTAAGTDEQPGLLAALVEKLTSIWAGATAADDDLEARPRRHTIDRSAPASRRAAAERPARPRRPRGPGSTDTADVDGNRPPRPRRPRPRVGDVPEPAAAGPARPRRPRSPAGYAADPPGERPRRQRPRPDIDAPPPPRRPRREPVREAGQSADRDRFDQRNPRRDPYETADRPPAPPPRRPREPSASGRPDPTHHPISQVRYRGSSTDEGSAEPGKRPLRRSGGKPGADTWEYDI